MKKLLSGAFILLAIITFTNNYCFAQYIKTIAGGAVSGLGEGGPATNAHLGTPSGICLDFAGNIYFSDQNDCRIRKIDHSGIITTVAGCGPPGGYTGDGGPADSAKIYWPEGLTVDKRGIIYIADNFNNVIRMVKEGFIYTIAGTGLIGFDTVDNIPATNANLWHPADVGVDNMGNVYFIDQANQFAKKIDTNGILTTVAGTGTAGFSGDGGPGTAAQLNWPEGIGVDTCGNVYIADLYNSRIRRVDAITGIITTVAGSGTAGPAAGDGGPATDAVLWQASAVGLDHSGNIYITDLSNSRIRKVDQFGIITTVAGDSVYGFGGDGGLATNASLNHPQGVTADDSGNVYIADYENYRIRQVYRVPVTTNNISKSQSRFDIFPNPSKGIFKFRTNIDIENYTFYVNNFLGQKVKELTFTSRENTLDLSDMQNGVYYLILRKEDKTIFKKLVILE